MSTPRSEPKALRGTPPVKHTGNFKITPGAIVCSEAQLSGDIAIGAKTVIHPTARIQAEGGPIIIGDNNLIMDRATIINRKKADGEATPILVIGDGNVFEFDCVIETRNVGNENTFEAKCHVGESVTVTDKCVIGSCCKLLTAETVPPSTIITGSNYDTWTRQATVQTSNQQQLDYLAKLLPNFHRLIKQPQKPPNN